MIEALQEKPVMKKLASGLALVLALTSCASSGMTASRSAAVAPAAPLESPISKVGEIKDFNEVARLVAELSAPTTLLVLDIDDTLLTSATFFGSDQWFGWQFSTETPEADKVPCLFDVQALSYEIGTMRVPQPETPSIVAGLSVDKLILTSRSPVSRSPTERELLLAEYQLPAQLTANGEALDFIPPGGTDRLTYANGIFMTQGGNKGVLLLELLKRIGRVYKTIVLVDDGWRNIEAMQDALAKAQISYYGFYYVAVDKPKTLPEALAVEGRRAWERFLKFLDQHSPRRKARLDARQCVYG
jgi:hypothetical protein